jgi:hypothetical protein
MKLRLALKVIRRAGPNATSWRYRRTTLRRAVRRFDRAFGRAVRAAKLFDCGHCQAVTDHAAEDCPWGTYPA